MSQTSDELFYFVKKTWKIKHLSISQVPKDYLLLKEIPNEIY